MFGKVREVPKNQDGEVSLPSLSKLLRRVSTRGPLPSPLCTVDRKEAAESYGTAQREVLGGLCQEPQHLRGLSGTQKDQHLGARCARTRTCATSDPSGAPDKGLAFDHGKEIDSLQSPG